MSGRVHKVSIFLALKNKQKKLSDSMIFWEKKTDGWQNFYSSKIYILPIRISAYNLEETLRPGVAHFQLNSTNGSPNHRLCEKVQIVGASIKGKYQLPTNEDYDKNKYSHHSLPLYLKLSLHLGNLENLEILSLYDKRKQ